MKITSYSLKNKLLFTLLIIVIFYLSIRFFINTKDGFNISDKPCVDKPYIMYDDRYICFDPLTKNHRTMSAFNHGKKMCEIVPNGKKLILKDPLNDNLEYTETTRTLCNPLEVYID